MPRKSRVWYPGATYHVMCRGNHRTEIFRSEADYLFYLDALRKAKEEKSFQMHGYCLMGNHVHLHIETDAINISIIMKKVNMLYAVYFNNKYKTVGHLFQDRFKSELIENDPYNLVISRYIHLNPVRAKITSNPVAYRWSSYAA